MGSSRSRALVKAEPRPGGLALREIPARDPGPGEARIRVLVAGVCGTDLAIFDWREWVWNRVRVPVTIGHEGCGVVEAVGPGVTEVAIGDRVAVESHLFCGHCPTCASGNAHMCEQLEYVGMHVDGLFAERAVLPSRLLYKLPADLSPELGALMEPLGLSVRAVLHGDGVRDKAVLVTGCGPLGLTACLVAAHMGARRIVASEVAPYRLDVCRQYARRLVALRVVNPQEENLLAVVGDVSCGRGVDVWLDFSGSESVLRMGYAALRARGEARLMGVGGSVPFDTARLVLQEIRTFGFHGRLVFDTWSETVRVLGALQSEIQRLVSHRLPLERYADAFALLKSGGAMKLLFELG